MNLKGNYFSIWYYFYSNIIIKWTTINRSLSGLGSTWSCLACLLQERLIQFLLNGRILVLGSQESKNFLKIGRNVTYLKFSHTLMSNLQTCFWEKCSVWHSMELSSYIREDRNSKVYRPPCHQEWNKPRLSISRLILILSYWQSLQLSIS